MQKKSYLTSRHGISAAMPHQPPNLLVSSFGKALVSQTIYPEVVNLYANYLVALLLVSERVKILIHTTCISKNC